MEIAVDNTQQFPRRPPLPASSHDTAKMPHSCVRIALAHVPKGQRTMVAATIRQAFIQPDHDNALCGDRLSGFAST